MVIDKKNIKMDPGTMRAAAKMYYRASEILNREARKNLSKDKRQGIRPIRTELAIPSIVLYAFTCETALKALIKKKGGNITKTHDLKELFDQLPIEMKERVKQKVRQNDRGGDAKDFVSLLENNKEAFEDWRYYYDLKKSKLKASVDFLKEFYKAIAAEFDNC